MTNSLPSVLESKRYYCFVSRSKVCKGDSDSLPLFNGIAITNPSAVSYILNVPCSGGGGTRLIRVGLLLLIVCNVFILCMIIILI